MSIGPLTASGVEVFYSYSHRDEELRHELEKHLVILKRQGVITSWHDRKIEAGREWKAEIDKHIDSAHIILLLVSSDFIASDYCYDVEMKKAMERHEAGEVSVIPIILRPVNWKGAPFAKLQALPIDAKPVTSWENTDDAFLNISEGIQKIAEALISQKKVKPSTTIFEHYENITAKDEREIPPLLPYLCNRRLQMDTLDISLQYYRKHRTRRPFICIIHGNSDEGHDQFKERLQKHSLPRLLSLNDDEDMIHDCFLDWPSIYFGKEQFHNMFHRNLAERLISRTASQKDLAKLISEQPFPLMIHTHLSTSNWETGGAEMLKAFIEYWNTFPDLPPGPHLIYCLFFAHKDISRKFVINKNKALSFLGQLDFANFSGVYGTVLPELNTVEEEDVKNWIRNDTIFSDFCPAHAPKFCEMKGPLKDIQALFKQLGVRVNQSAEPCIPMDTLAEYLAKIINKYRCIESKT